MRNFFYLLLRYIIMNNILFNIAMHAVGIHSAMAIKRQRKRRDEQRRAKERRYSIQSSESGDTHNSPHGSTRRKYRHPAAHSAGNGMLDTKVNNSLKSVFLSVVWIELIIKRFSTPVR